MNPPWLERLLLEIEHLSTLQENWDQYGAPVIDSKIITMGKTFARAMVRFMPGRPRVVPLSTGTFQFEWFIGKTIIEFEFELPGRIVYLFATDGESQSSSFGVTDYETAIRILAKLHSSPLVGNKT